MTNNQQYSGSLGDSYGGHSRNLDGSGFPRGQLGQHRKGAPQNRMGAGNSYPRRLQNSASSLSPKETGANANVPPYPLKFDEFGNYRASGVLEMHPNGFGFLRDPEDSYVRHKYDPFVSCGAISRLGLREGVRITADVRKGTPTNGPRVCAIYDVDGMSPEDYVSVPKFDDLTPVTPHDMLRLEWDGGPLSTRVMDVLTPLGKGQRALLVAPPRSGKTMLLQQICQAVRKNYPDIYTTVLLIDERPEEVTDFKRSVDAEVISSSLDCELESHVHLAEFVITRCKRLAEMGKDVFLLLDSITRLARAYNKWVGNSGRTMTGGLDVKAMDTPKKIFSSARQLDDVCDESGKVIRKGGSLTIVGTALIDTGSRMDELIFQEFKGTGNMELVLDRRLADRRIWPAIDVTQSGTRREEMLLSPAELRVASYIRRSLLQRDPVDAMSQLTATLSRFRSNADIVNQLVH
ncbi:MAG: transcription termination factor Rho [Thermoguttaceae bacterium]